MMTALSPLPLSKASAPSDSGGRWGASLPFSHERLPTQIDQCRRLAGEGYTDFWTLEASGWDAFTPLAMAATALPDAHVGTAIVPVFTRGAATLAGHAAATAELFGDRFKLGLGEIPILHVIPVGKSTFDAALSLARSPVRTSA